MTLITWVLTAEYAVVSSDRRVTRFVRGRAVSFEDSAMKTFLLNGQLLMGYTGLAEIGGQSTTEWVAELLADTHPLSWPERLRSGLQDYYDATPSVRPFPHHFRILGFGFRPGQLRSRVPMGFEVGNCSWHEAGGTVQAFGVGDFRVVQNVFGNQKVLVGAIGSPYRHRDLRDLTATVKALHRANPKRVLSTFDPLLRFHARVAASSGGTVGATAIVTSIMSQNVPIQELGWSVALTPEGLESATQSPFSATYSADGNMTAHLPAIIQPDVQLLGMTFGPVETDEVRASPAPTDAQ